MTWHLKDRELEKKLIEICPDFLECIDFAIQTKEKDADYIYLEFDRERENVTLGFNYLYFWDDELEDIPEYNPKAWNKFPKVKPPYDIMMRIEFENGEGTKGFYKHCLDGSDYWFGNSRMAFSKNMLINNPIKRFRPWED